MIAISHHCDKTLFLGTAQKSILLFRLLPSKGKTLTEFAYISIRLFFQPINRLKAKKLQEKIRGN